MLLSVQGKIRIAILVKEKSDCSELRFSTMGVKALKFEEVQGEEDEEAVLFVRLQLWDGGKALSKGSTGRLTIDENLANAHWVWKASREKANAWITLRVDQRATVTKRGASPVSGPIETTWILDEPVKRRSPLGPGKQSRSCSPRRRPLISNGELSPSNGELSPSGPWLLSRRCSSFRRV
jgi:hypothetical protein